MNDSRVANCLELQIFVGDTCICTRSRPERSLNILPSLVRTTNGCVLCESWPETILAVGAFLGSALVWGIQSSICHHKSTLTQLMTISCWPSHQPRGLPIHMSPIALPMPIRDVNFNSTSKSHNLILYNPTHPQSLELRHIILWRYVSDLAFTQYLAYVLFSRAAIQSRVGVFSLSCLPTPLLYIPGLFPPFFIYFFVRYDKLILSVIRPHSEALRRSKPSRWMMERSW